MNNSIVKGSISHLAVMALAGVGAATIPVISWLALTALACFVVFEFVSLMILMKFDNLVGRAAEKAKSKAELVRSMLTLKELGNKVLGIKYPVVMDFILYSASAYILYAFGHNVLGGMVLLIMALDCSRAYVASVLKGLAKVELVLEANKKAA